MLKLSVCLITKNEEENIRKNLIQLRDCADEIIVVDTGSVDSTCQIAQSLGAQVYFYAWQENFAAAKNYALMQASGDWIVFLDADEFFSAAALPRVRRVIERYGGACDALLTKMVNIDTDENNRFLDAFYTIRVFRHLPDLRYEGVVHEQLRRGSGEALRIAKVPADELLLYHTGYSSGKQAEKARRNLPLLLRAVRAAKMPEIYYDSLAEVYMGLQDYENAVHYAALRIAAGKKADTYASKAYRVLIEGMKNLAAPEEEIQKRVQEAIREFPDLPDFYAEYGLMLYRRRLWDEAYQYFQTALDKNRAYHGVEPSVLEGSLDILRQLSEETGRRRLLDREKNEMKKIYADKDSDKNERELIHKVARGMQRLVCCLMLQGDAASAKDAELLPRSLAVIFHRFGGRGANLTSADFPMYMVLLPQVLDLHHPGLREQYLRLGLDFSGKERIQAAQVLYRRRLFSDMFLLLGKERQKVLSTEEENYWLGVACFYAKRTRQAKKYLETARRLGAAAPELQSYLKWTQEKG